MDTMKHPSTVGEAEQTVVQATRGLSSTFSALHHRNFRLFWSGQLISLIGTWMQTTGQSWLVLQLTHSAWWLGIVGALQFLPILIFSLFGGVLADRLPKRKVLLATQAVAALIATVLWLLVFTQTIQLWEVLVLALLLGTTNSLDMPTRQSFVVEMVGREDLSNAVALNSSIFNLARIVGPGLAGLIIAWVGEAPLFLFNALSFIPVIIGLAMIDLTKLHAPTRRVQENDKSGGTFKSLTEGLSYTRQTPSIFLIIMTVGLVSLFGINFNVVLPLFADTVLNVGPQGFGFISSAFGIGSLLSALWMAWNHTQPSIRQIILGGLFFSVFELLFAFSHLYVFSLLLIAAVGFTQILFSAMANTTLQTVTPHHLRGRIMGIYLLVFAGTNPIGNLLTGLAASTWGASVALGIGAVLSLLAAITAWLYKKPAEKSFKEFTHRDN
ncbi:MFS transporter [Tengunoibacter tsumagoiensis]|uniref:MFS transporter n=1 Tax=Tengunoibacter tsumagoiensis TaxID=2014871 RepID=A0A401ZY57_9CHLR|nr:MFS transporter [Tengunoibacter tsumagoiensis]GCE11781.1 MFS transporter [Tengunoibacter tsumagoiensis]